MTETHRSDRRFQPRHHPYDRREGGQDSAREGAPDDRSEGYHGHAARGGFSSYRGGHHQRGGYSAARGGYPRGGYSSTSTRGGQRFTRRDTRFPTSDQPETQHTDHADTSAVSDAADTSLASENGEPRRVDLRTEQRFISNNDYTARQRYNQVPNNNRNHSQVMRLRDFNNFVKWMLVFEFSRPHMVVFDMACGKGGDLEKWRRAGVDGYIGVDIADVSVEQARERYRRMETHPFWADFEVGNCFGEDIRSILHPGALPVDVVSCQFAFHYAFDTMERARMTLGNISASLQSGGVFFGTMINADYLTEQLKERLPKGEHAWGNDIFSITFDSDAECVTKTNGEFHSLVGNRYVFYLSESVNHIPEYAVPFDKLVELFKEFGFSLIKREPFLHYFDQGVNASADVLAEAINKRLTNERGVPTFSSSQLEVCSIYTVFAFRKD